MAKNNTTYRYKKYKYIYTDIKNTKREREREREREKEILTLLGWNKKENVFLSLLVIMFFQFDSYYVQQFVLIQCVLCCCYQNNLKMSLEFKNFFFY